jgi:hypothetical protein
VLKDVEFKDGSEQTKAESVKIVACDGKSTAARDERD